MDTNGQVCILCEQGDMGLFGDPLNEKDQALYEAQEEEKKKENK